MSAAYYNEIDPYCAQWLRNLITAGCIAKGDVDERDIREVRADDLRGYAQCHFLAGIGGWSRALRLAGWPDGEPVWSGSCPCQPLSGAGQRKGHADERHLWPAFHRLVAERRPAVVLGEQVASNLGREWLAGVRADLERLGYACGCADLPAACVGAPHIRQRLWFVAERLDDAEAARPSHRGTRAVQPELGECGGEHSGLAFSTREQVGNAGQSRQRAGAAGGVGDAAGTRPQGGREHPVHDGRTTGAGFWNDSRLISCTDGKARRVTETESSIFPLADRLPEAVDGLGPVSRVGVLKGAGNAIVPQVAAVFIRAYLDVRDAA